MLMSKGRQSIKKKKRKREREREKERKRERVKERKKVIMSSRAGVQNKRKGVEM